MQPLFVPTHFLFSSVMFKSSELLEKINRHIAELQFTRRRPDCTNLYPMCFRWEASASAPS